MHFHIRFSNICARIENYQNGQIKDMNDIRDNSGSYLLQRMLNCYNTLRTYDGKTTRRMFLSDKNISVIFIRNNLSGVSN